MVETVGVVRVLEVRGAVEGRGRRRVGVGAHGRGQARPGRRPWGSGRWWGCKVVGVWRRPEELAEVKGDIWCGIRRTALDL